jgi:hypothetical protein
MTNYEKRTNNDVSVPVLYLVPEAAGWQVDTEGEQ